MNKKVKCPICGTEIDDVTYEDCPYCDWTYVGYEEEMEDNEIDSANPVSKYQAKENLKKGLNIWGDPLPKKE